jgi:putative hemolysin
LIEGWMPVDEFANLLGIPLPLSRPYNTAAGFMLQLFGAIPDAGDTRDTHGWRFEIVDLDGRRIDKILATRIAQPRRAL